jgi:hypothetical protein
VQVTAASPYAITVSGASTGVDTSVGFTIAESQLDLKVLATPLTLDTNPVPSTVALTVKQGTTSIYTAASFLTSTATLSNTTPIWVAPSLAYTLTADPGSTHGVGWSSATATVTPTSSSTAVTASVPLNEKGGTFNITVRLKAGNALVDGATVSVTPADAAVTPPTDDVTDKGLVSFTQLPPGKYDITATKVTTAADGSTVTQTGTDVAVGIAALSKTITIA